MSNIYLLICYRTSNVFLSLYLSDDKRIIYIYFFVIRRMKSEILSNKKWYTICVIIILFWSKILKFVYIVLYSINIDICLPIFTRIMCLSLSANLRRVKILLHIIPFQLKSFWAHEGTVTRAKWMIKAKVESWPHLCLIFSRMHKTNIFRLVDIISLWLML